MPDVKICGLTRVEDARHAARSGASFLGVILAGGPRHLTLPEARQVLGAPRHGVRRVAVVGDQSAEDVIALASALAVDVVQMHGRRPPAEAVQIGRTAGCEVWPVLRITGATLPEDAIMWGAVSGTLVLDAFVAGQLGGTGVALDWSGMVESVAALRRELPALRLVLAGGLRPENVADAVRLLSPQVVDVSSGVESAPGVKDPVRVQQFVRAAHRAAEMSR
ncbi:MAG: phosphoribosylanthranilate isomerase [Gemmatimonas sp.]|jgi:phosphoribosylanthranilate isomerase|uniref:phosphoribosylanthranilate isomerase n=1 Tax=Gemmatimonas sp. TaxID=1962908 RepID=UPI00391D190E